MMKAQEIISADTGKLESMSLTETLALSQQVIEESAMSKFGFEALRGYIADGADVTLARYKMLSSKNEKMFGEAYRELLAADAWIKSLDQRLRDFKTQGPKK